MRLLLAVLVTLSSLAFGAPEAKATLRAADGRTVGIAALSAVKGGVRVIVTVTGIEPGNHAFHVHTVGACVAPTFSSAGAQKGRHSGFVGFSTRQAMTALALSSFTGPKDFIPKSRSTIERAC